MDNLAEDGLLKEIAEMRLAMKADAEAMQRMRSACASIETTLFRMVDHIKAETESRLKHEG